MPTEKYLLGTYQALMSTSLNSLANNGQVLGGAYDNTAGGTGDGATLCDLELVVAFGTAPGVNTAIKIWFLAAPNGTNYEDGGSSVTPVRNPDRLIRVGTVTTVQRLNYRIWLPWGLLKPLLKNDGTGQSFAASGNTLSIRPVSYQG